MRLQNAVRSSGLLNLLVVLACTALFIWLRWKKIDSLVMFDPPRWMQEAFRLSRGEMPYRDFSWQYPPLSIFLLGWSLRWFGALFTVVQIFVDVLSVAVVLLSYAVVRKLFPKSLHAIVILALIVVCATNAKYPLFSMLVYTPAVLTGTVGLLLLMIGVLAFLRAGRIEWGAATLIVSGFWIAALSKPEAAAAAVLALATLALTDPALRGLGRDIRSWLIRYSLLGTACLAGPLAVYAWIGLKAGFANLSTGVAGYGITSLTCPWWPTGLGLCTALAAVCEASFAVAILSLMKKREFQSVLGSRFPMLLAAGLIGGLGWVAWICFTNFRILSAPDISDWNKIRMLVSSTLWLNPLLLPVLWTVILFWAFLCWRLLFGRSQPATQLFDARELAVILSLPVAMSLRSLFGHILSPFPEVPAMCYPFLLIFAPYLTWLFLRSAERQIVSGPLYRSPQVLVIASLSAFIMLRLVAGYPSMLSGRPFRTLQTLAGSVRLSDYDVNAGVYRYVLEHTGPSDRILDLPYGGGINFAAHRPTTIFDTVFWNTPIPQIYQNLDLKLFKEHPPKVIIAQDKPNYGTHWGVLGNVACPCPRFVWSPDQPSWKPGSVFPVVEYIQGHYHVDRRIGDRLLLLQD